MGGGFEARLEVALELEVDMLDPETVLLGGWGRKEAEEGVGGAEDAGEPLELLSPNRGDFERGMEGRGALGGFVEGREGRGREAIIDRAAAAETEWGEQPGKNKARMNQEVPST